MSILHDITYCIQLDYGSLDSPSDKCCCGDRPSGNPTAGSANRKLCFLFVFGMGGGRGTKPQRRHEMNEYQVDYSNTFHSVI